MGKKDPFGRDDCARMTAIARTFDPGTIQVLSNIGIAEGRWCLEVGAGAGSIAAWMADRVGGTGRVLATDVDTSCLSHLTQDNVEVLEHDIVSGGLPADAFDLVHSRLVLDLIPDRKIALRNMVRAVKPGGWVVVEEFDSITSVPDSVIGESGVAVFRRIQDAMFMSWNEKGIDAYLGRKILMELRSCGLEQLGGEGRVFMRQGGSDGTIGWRMSVESLRKDFLTGQFATNEEIDAHLRQLDDPELAYMSPLMMATWGRRPHSSSKK